MFVPLNTDVDTDCGGGIYTGGCEAGFGGTIISFGVKIILTFCFSVELKLLIGEIMFPMSAFYLLIIYSILRRPRRE